MGAQYRDYLEQTGLKEYRTIIGLRDVLGLTRPIDDATEYVLITLREDMEATRRFAGPDPERAVYYPEDDRYFPKDQITRHVRRYRVNA